MHKPDKQSAVVRATLGIIAAGVLASGAELGVWPVNGHGHDLKPPPHREESVQRPDAERRDREL